MQMQHHFTVPAPIDVAWHALLDPERVAPCMPGASLTGVEGHEFTGSVQVQLGPISLAYEGTGAFSTVDADARRLVVDASGEDAGGNGTAVASVAAVLTEQVGSAGSATAVQVDTDLEITGEPAQLGRGLISEVGGKILAQFARRLAERLAGPEAPADTAGASAESGGSTADQNGRRSAREGGRAGAAAPVGKAPGWRVTPAAAHDKRAAGELGAAAKPGEPSTDGAIDLLDAPGTPVLQRVLPVLAALAAVGAVVLAVRRRRRR